MHKYFHYKHWECARTLFFARQSKSSLSDSEVLAIMNDIESWGRIMLKVVEEWPVSSNQFLSDPAINKKAWIGQASLSYFYNIPAEKTKKCWFMLSKKKRNAANKKAEKAIIKWRALCLNSIQISMYLPLPERELR